MRLVVEEEEVVALSGLIMLLGVRSDFNYSICLLFEIVCLLGQCLWGVRR